MNEEIARLWNEGWSSNGIARKLRVSKKVVMGRVYRMRHGGLPLRQGAAPTQRDLNRDYR